MFLQVYINKKLFSCDPSVNVQDITLTHSIC